VTMGLSYSRPNTKPDARSIGCRGRRALAPAVRRNPSPVPYPLRQPTQERRFLQALASRGVGTEPRRALVPITRVVPETGWNPAYLLAELVSIHSIVRVASSCGVPRLLAARSFIRDSLKGGHLSKLPSARRLSQFLRVLHRISQQGVRRTPHLRQQVI